MNQAQNKKGGGKSLQEKQNRNKIQFVDGEWYLIHRSLLVEVMRQAQGSQKNGERSNFILAELPDNLTTK